MREFIKKIINYAASINNRQTSLLKEIVLNNLNNNSIKHDSDIDNEKLFDLLIDLKGTSLVEGINIVNSLVEVLNLDGDVCEFGVAQGKTSKLIAYLIKNTEKKFFLFDSFRGLPKPSKEDELNSKFTGWSFAGLLKLICPPLQRLYPMRPELLGHLPTYVL